MERLGPAGHVVMSTEERLAPLAKRHLGERGHFDLGATSVVTAKLKCPLLSKVEMSGWETG